MMRLRHAPVLLLALAACASAPRASAPRAAAPVQPADEAGVYAAVIDHVIPAGRTALLIDSAAAARSRVGSDVQVRATPELAAGFTEANRAARALPRPLPSARTIQLIRRGELPFGAGDPPATDPEAHWQRFNERYPGAQGYYEFSSIGFDAARTSAVVYVSHSCGSLCGSGSLVTLRHTGGRWQVATAEPLWVS